MEGRIIVLAALSAALVGEAYAFQQLSSLFAMVILAPILLIIIFEILQIRKTHGRKKSPPEHGVVEQAERVHDYDPSNAIKSAKWAEKKTNPSRYESLQKELEKS